MKRLAAAAALFGMLWVVADLVATRTPFGAWVRSMTFGVRWQDAYAALETAEANLPRDPRERERLLLAWAQVEGTAPEGVPAGPRLHRAGTVARLRYEALDEVGEAYDTWEVRALVPPLPALDDASGPLGKPGCPAECQEALARGGLRLERSGDPGLAPEWVLRMPVGGALDLGPQPIATQDLFDREPRRLGLQSVREGDHEVLRPAGLRVTLLEACEADVRVGSMTRLDFEPSVIVPIFRGFRRRWWAQVDGCPGLLQPPARAEQALVLPAPPPPPMPEPPPLPTPLPVAVPAPEPPPTPKPMPPSAPRIAAPPPPQGPQSGTPAPGVHVSREPGTGFLSLRVDEAALQRQGRPLHFEARDICRYDAAADRWRLEPWSLPSRRIRILPRAAGEGRAEERVALHLPREAGLFRVRWIEADADGGPTPRETLLTSGAILCNDVMLRPPPPGRIAACVPFPDHAEARFVPQPPDECEP